MSSICSTFTPQLVNWKFHVLIIHYSHLHVLCYKQSDFFFFILKKREREREAIIWSGTQKIKWMHSANEPFQTPDQNINHSWFFQNRTVTVWFINASQKLMCWKLSLQLIISPEYDETIRRWGLTGRKLNHSGCPFEGDVGF